MYTDVVAELQGTNKINGAMYLNDFAAYKWPTFLDLSLYPGYFKRIPSSSLLMQIGAEGSRLRDGKVFLWTVIVGVGAMQEPKRDIPRLVRVLKYSFSA